MTEEETIAHLETAIINAMEKVKTPFTTGNAMDALWSVFVVCAVVSPHHDHKRFVEMINERLKEIAPQ